MSDVTIEKTLLTLAGEIRQMHIAKDEVRLRGKQWSNTVKGRKAAVFLSDGTASDVWPMSLLSHLGRVPATIRQHTVHPGR